MLRFQTFFCAKYSHFGAVPVHEWIYCGAMSKSFWHHVSHGHSCFVQIHFQFRVSSIADRVSSRENVWSCEVERYNLLMWKLKHSYTELPISFKYPRRSNYSMSCSSMCSFKKWRPFLQQASIVSFISVWAVWIRSLVLMKNRNVSTCSIIQGWRDVKARNFYYDCVS